LITHDVHHISNFLKSSDLHANIVYDVAHLLKPIKWMIHVAILVKCKCHIQMP